MDLENIYSEKLFSYGTLQQEAVQFSTFGRKLKGVADVLLGYQLKDLEIKDAHVIAISGKAVHAVLMRTGNKVDAVKGTVFNISPEELAAADRYEVADYKRISVKLSSGIAAWVYVSVDSKDE
jgi:gamma-glutamylcyclotransferase (GGCT)/AIG2-like uncharacterized protein YtfP